MRRNVLETIMGGLVLLVALGFLVILYQDGGIKHNNHGYPLIVRFDHADGLVPGTDVRVGGIKVGSVTNQRLDNQTYQAIVTISVDPSLHLPRDTSAKITSDGLLGSNYLALSPGAEDEMMQPGDEITHAQGAVNVLDLIAKYAFGSAKSDSPQPNP